MPFWYLLYPEFLLPHIISELPQRILLLSVPVQLGHNMATTVSWGLDMIELLVNASLKK